MSLRSGSKTGSKLGAMEKKIPQSKKYANVESKINSGMTVDKVKIVTTKQHLRRRDEPFYRLSPNQLYELFAEYEQDAAEAVEDLASHMDPDHHGPRIVVHEEEAKPQYQRPYLLLDVRSREEFETGHITQARSFPSALFNQDRMTPELFGYKNKEGTLVVLYEDDERLAMQGAVTLIHRGFDNIFVLTGGLFSFSDAYPDFVEGQPARRPSSRAQPKGTSRASTAGSIKSAVTAASRSSGVRQDPSTQTSESAMRSLRISSRRSSAGDMTDRGSGAGTARSTATVGRAGGGVPRAMAEMRGLTSRRSSAGMVPDRLREGGTQASNASVAESIISRASARKERGF